MTLKTRITLNLILATSVILAIILLIIFFAFSKFRKEEFHRGLEASVNTTKRYISKLPAEKLVIINNFETLEGDEREDYITDEAVEVYNAKRVLVYRSRIPMQELFPVEYFINLKPGENIFFSKGVFEFIATKVYINEQPYFIFTQAEDARGNSNLQFLKILLIVLYVLCIGIISTFSFVFIQKQLKPLDDFKNKIRKITVSNLTSKIEERETNDEVNVLIKAFNKLMQRLSDSFQSQKEFNASASHEMKTPLTRIAFQLENVKAISKSDEIINYIDSVQTDVYRLSDTLNSLLILTKLEETSHDLMEDVRLDEVIFDAFAAVKNNYPDFEIDFLIEEYGFGELTIIGNKSLLEIVFINIYKNAALYSKEPKAFVSIKEDDDRILVKIKNEGRTLSTEEQERIFNAFSRGENSTHIPGSGLGLRISKRIMNYHSAEISYHVEENIYNIIQLLFNKTKI